MPDNPLLGEIYNRLNSAAKVKGNKEYTFSSWKPSRQIDYIFLPKECGVLSYEVVNLRASDHFPITAEIEL